jgi:hypothetical protein
MIDKDNADQLDQPGTVRAAGGRDSLLVILRRRLEIERLLETREASVDRSKW